MWIYLLYKHDKYTVLLIEFWIKNSNIWFIAFIFINLQIFFLFGGTDFFQTPPPAFLLHSALPKKPGQPPTQPYFLISGQ